uniref:Uncharacterized protein n=1 Tax=Theileria annulata TaxID=5874 RepID=A0A3B0NID3_THEAN
MKEYEYNFNINSQNFKETFKSSEITPSEQFESLEIGLPEQFESLEMLNHSVSDICVINSEKIAVSAIKSNDLGLRFGEIYIIDLNSKESIFPILNCIILAEVIGNTLQSLDSFGNLAKWSLENLSKPFELLELKKENNISNITVGTHGSEIICGTCSGQIIKISDQVKVNQAHRSFISEIDYNPSNIGKILANF